MVAAFGAVLHKVRSEVYLTVGCLLLARFHDVIMLVTGI